MAMIDMAAESAPLPNGVAASGTVREAPEPHEARAALVKKLTEMVRQGKTHHESRHFKKMRADMKFARGQQWEEDGESSENKYVANLVLRHLNTLVNSIYAKNPTAVALRRRKLDYAVWDERPESLGAALMAVQAGMPSPQDVALLQDVSDGSARRVMLERLGKTLELAFAYFLNEGQPRFKGQAKQLVRRVATCGVGYMKVGYQRQLQHSPEREGRIGDMTPQLENLARLRSDVVDGVVDADSPAAEQATMMAEVLAGQEPVMREGLVFSFPRSTSLIVDPRCQQLRGFVGARWVAEEFLLRPEEIQEVYKVNLGATWTRYLAVEGGGAQAAGSGGDGNSDTAMACVWQLWDRPSGMVYVLVDGYSDFLHAGPPDIYVEPFFPYIPVMFNEVEDENDPFPPSDVQLLRDAQKEHNRARYGLRIHRQASTPFYLHLMGLLDEENQKKLKARVPHEIVSITGLPAGAKSNDVFTPAPTLPVDPNLYSTQHLFEDMQRVRGNQEANLGGTSGATATESSIAEASRTVDLSSSADELDEALTDMARMAAQILLLELPPELAREIAGPGAVWPDMTRQEVSSELSLEIVAGSSGRPNAAQELANWERATPLLTQIPGISPNWLARKVLEALDPRIVLSDAIAEGMPSIIAQNAASKGAPAAPGNDNPEAQGGRGGERPAGPGTSPGGQPAYPSGPQDTQGP